jgi:hypothetical protein
MPASARIEKLVILDELDTRMRRTAARLSALASGVADSAATPEGAAVAAAHLAGALALAPSVPEMDAVVDELKGAVARLAPMPGMPPETVALVALAELDLAATGDEQALERAAAWARRLSSPEGAEGAPESGCLGARAALALAKAATAMGEARFREAAEREIAALPTEGEGAAPVVVARALAVLGGDDRIAQARAACEAAAFCLACSGAEPAGTDAVATADAILLASELMAASGDTRGSAQYLDAIERAALNDLLFEQTDCGAAVAGRTLDGEAGSVDDAAGTPALARGLACTARHSLTADAEGRVVAGIAANAVATVRVGGLTDMRCIVSTQLPVRGWTRWTFEPAKASSAPSASASTLRPARRKRIVTPVPGAAAAPEREAEPAPATFTFLVRVPGWASSEKGGPVIKVDKQKASVKNADGFLVFEVPTGRTTEIEVVVRMAPGVVDRQSPVSWAKEAAVMYGPLVLTASARLNPGENLSMPLRIVSPVAEFVVAADLRRRLPVVEVKALGGGGRVAPVLFSPLSEVGGLAEGPDGAGIRCAPFRTWHRLGR